MMRDERDHFIYVGKANNLRQRLNSYRYPARLSRKTVRLVHAVRRIEWELSESNEAAQLRENDLIRTHRPRFNRLGTWPKANCFILMQAGESRIRFAVTRESPLPRLMQLDAPYFEPECEFGVALESHRPVSSLDNSASVRLFGAFKPGAAWALAALLRLLWQALHQLNERTALPRRLLADRFAATFDVDHTAAPAWTEPLTLYFTGESSVVIDALGANLPPPTTAFEEQTRRSDLERLQHFFLVGPQRNRTFNRRRPNPAVPIGQEELDDLMVVHRLQ